MAPIVRLVHGRVNLPVRAHRAMVLRITFSAPAGPHWSLLRVLSVSLIVSKPLIGKELATSRATGAPKVFRIHESPN